MSTRGILYLTCNTHDAHIEHACRAQLLSASGDMPIACASREPTDFGTWNVVVAERRSAETLMRQILAGLECLPSDLVFFAENDVLYHPSHFDFTPPRDDTFYYNTNVWRVRYADGHAARTTFCQQTSGLCAHRALLLEHYRARAARIAREGKFDRRIGFEPGTHRLPRGIDNHPSIAWESRYPNLDIRHDRNFTPSKWSPVDFRNQRFAEGWVETDGDIAGWGKGADVMARVRAQEIEEYAL